jgi:phosphoserine phosphatase
LCAIIRVRYHGEQGLLTASFMEISRTMDVDIFFQEDNMFRRNRRLVCFDMDSTLIQTEVIDELADLGV